MLRVQTKKRGGIMKIGENKVVALDYKVYDADTKELLEDTAELGPYYYIQGMGLFLPKIEAALDSKSKGYKTTIEIPMEEAYGDYDEELVEELTKADFADFEDIYEGMEFVVELEDGSEMVAVITEIEQDINLPIWVENEANMSILAEAIINKYKDLEDHIGIISMVLDIHIADKKLYELGSVSSSFFKKKTTRQDLFMQTTFAVLGHLSKSKGRVTEEDIQLANQLMIQLKLDDTGRKLAQDAFRRGKESDFPIRQVIREFRIGCGQRADLLRMFLQVQVQAAFADSELHENEKEVLYVIAEELGLSRMQFEQMIAMEMAARAFTQGGFYQQYQQGAYQGGYQYQQQNSGGYQHASGPTLNDAYKVLGVTESDEQNTVKRAYRRLMNEHHPDKLVAKGLPPEMMEMAKEKTQQIQAAYDLICKAKGWK